MKRTLVILFASVLLAGCASSALTDRRSPCKDPYFNTLRHKNIDSMTAREFEYFKMKSSECETYLAGKEVVESVEGVETYIIVVDILSFVAAVIFLVVKPF